MAQLSKLSVADETIELRDFNAPQPELPPLVERTQDDDAFPEYSPAEEAEMFEAWIARLDVREAAERESHARLVSAIGAMQAAIAVVLDEPPNRAA